MEINTLRVESSLWIGNKRYRAALSGWYFSWAELDKKNREKKTGKLFDHKLFRWHSLKIVWRKNDKLLGKWDSCMVIWCCISRIELNWKSGRRCYIYLNSLFNSLYMFISLLFFFIRLSKEDIQAIPYLCYWCWKREHYASIRNIVLTPLIFIVWVTRQ